MCSQTFQKDAILRRMKEYRREKSDLEKSVRALEEQSKHYKDNLRLVDAWWKQVGHCDRARDIIDADGSRSLTRLAFPKTMSPCPVRTHNRKPETHY